jgi:homoserine kinase
MKINVKIPATTANLGPGFDTLGLALDLWNQASFSPAEDFSVEVKGEGAGRLPRDRRNLILRAALRLSEAAGKALPSFKVECTNRIPLGSGLGSSAAAALTGLLGANALLGEPLSQYEILSLAVEMEGHPDNVAAALLGGLVAVSVEEGKIIARKLPVDAALHVTVVVPDVAFPTKRARAVLPKQVPMQAAVRNLSRAVLVTQALAAGDLELLARVMQDELHQPYRLPLIPGAQAAIQAGREAGAAAVVLSGAGPSLVAFSAKGIKSIGEGMKEAFAEAGLEVRVLELGVSEEGAKMERN